MHNFCGIIKTNTASALTGNTNIFFYKLRQDFPSAFAGSKLITSAILDIQGNVLHIPVNKSDLFFCGEIYNADIQTLPLQIETVGLYNCVAKLNGRFMVCFVNHAEQKLYLLTDQMAIQQIFYYQGNGFLLFASSIAFLLKHPACPKEIDWYNALRRSIAFEVLDGERNYHAWFREVYLLKEATAIELKFQSNQHTQHTYWKPALNMVNDARTSKQVMDEYIQLLKDAVNIRIKDHDTAFSFLSGGVDSSIICSMAAAVKPLHTYSIINQTTIIEGTSELCFRMANDLNFSNMQFVLPVHRLNLERELWKKRIWRSQSPFTHNDMLAKTMLHYTINHINPGVDYILTGTGSDQHNGGLTRWIVEDSGSMEEDWQHLIGKIAEAEKRYHLPERLHALWGARDYLNIDFIEMVSNKKMESNPFMFYVNSNLHINQFVLLWDENRAAGDHGHSVRYPFIDHRFAEFIGNVPVHVHKDLFYDKQILRQPAARYLPDYILNKPKAPANLGNYDKRFNEYKNLISSKDLSLLEEAFGPLNEPHAVIDKKGLIAEIKRLEQKPDHKAWQYLMNVINLGLLEQLPQQDEKSMEYEDEVWQTMDAVKEMNAVVKSIISKSLDIIPDEEVLHMKVAFAPGCGLVTEHRTGKIFFNKNEMLVYELDEAEVIWKQFVFAIDNETTVAGILQNINTDFETVREYFFLCMKEKIFELYMVAEAVRG